MGTNYFYWPKPDCACCGRPFDRIHIGKSSGGWCFGLHVAASEPIRDEEDEGCPTDLDGWIKMFARPESRITDEYGERITPERMVEIITMRSCPKADPLTDDWLRQNSAEPGPAGLARHKIGRFCVAHGEGTWDLLTGYFR